MDEKQLMSFIKKIIANTKGNHYKTENVLGELKRILEAQNAAPEHIEIVHKAINSIPEIYDLAGNAQIFPGNINAAFNKSEARRLEERRRREEAYRNQGRC